ncbi:MAG TPA: alpha/beta hydrolase [Solirubrobacteraceae bacterium]|jgi:acetyl esterase/lipase|nr:alpha/beta hydrolase [Solirubrobacteraceae bacterium]
MPSPQLTRLVELLRERSFRPGDSLERRRAEFESVADRARLPEDVTVTVVDVAGRPGEWLTPEQASEGRTILHLHGGGYVLGSCHTHRGLGTWLARAARARVLTLNYRLAPEHPHPAAVEDAVAAYQWLLGEGLAPGGIAISGDSAGGGLTVATLVALRERGLPLPAAAVPISPWTDLTLPAGSIDSSADRDPQVSRWVLEEMAGQYLAGADPRAPLASPRFADLAGLPPMLIHVGGAEGLLDDAQALADAAHAAGVEVTLEVWPDMIHVWHAFAPILPEALEGLDRIAGWLDGQWR